MHPVVNCCQICYEPSRPVCSVKCPPYTVPNTSPLKFWKIWKRARRFTASNVNIGPSERSNKMLPGSRSWDKKMTKQSNRLPCGFAFYIVEIEIPLCTKDSHCKNYKNDRRILMFSFDIFWPCYTKIEGRML